MLHFVQHPRFRVTETLHCIQGDNLGEFLNTLNSGRANVTENVMIVVYVPVEDTEAVRRAMCDAGAGSVDDGRYDRVTYTSQAVCQYRALDAAHSKFETAGDELRSEENRIEAICRRDLVEAVVRAICRAHPYETPAISIYPTLSGEYKYWTEAPR